MTINSITQCERETGVRRRAMLFGLANLLVASSALAGVCTETAELVFNACGYEGRDDRLMGRATCLNITDIADRDACNAEVADALQEHTATCTGQREARLEVCAAIGDVAYEPDYAPELFDSDFSALSNPNRYYPLAIGNRWEYRGNGEFNAVVVTDRTKRIEGLNCIVVVDKVFRGGSIKENTDDWFCQAKNGDVHYLGEETKSYRTFRGDQPRIPELLDNDGSFKSGREGAKGGLIFLAEPVVGAVYFEEFALGEAEDIAEVISTTYRFGENTDLDLLVPQGLAEYFCGGGDCVVTRNTSQLEPGVVEYKYYARDIGMFLETDPDTGELVRLSNCSFDPRCATVPQP